ncbi:MAG: hypothetical protein AAGB01_06835 [Cyanobacteria bacterium P01_F01_bin.42]
MNELRAALELATEEELIDLTEILFRKKLNPLDYLQGVDPDLVMGPDKAQWLNAIEDRFMYLAADGLTVLRGKTHRVSYRYVLIRVCRYLKLHYSPTWTTADLEAEIFLALMQRNWSQIPRLDQERLLKRIMRALAKDPANPLPLNCSLDSLRLLLSGGSAIAVSSVARTLILKQISRQVVLYWGTLEVAGKAVAILPKPLLAHLSRHGLSLGLTRYGLARSAFAALGCAVWAGFFVDLGWRSISTNYGRIIPIIFTLAQIRLTRGTSLAFA